jgi:type I restriction enzyme S subunit
MSQGANLVQTKELITDAAVAECGGKLIPSETLVMSFKLSVGKLGFVRTPMYTNEAIAALPIRRGKRLDSRFLYRALQAIRLSDGADRAVMGLTLNMEKLARVPVRYPDDPAEQRRIADILDKADAIRRKRKEAIALTDEILRSTFLEMFGDPVTNPKGWPTATIGELCERGASLVDGPFGSSLKPEHYTARGVRVIRNWNIEDDRFNESQFKFIAREKFEELRRSEVASGDVLMTTKGTVGDVCLMPELPGPSVLSASGTVRLRLPPSNELLGPVVVRQMNQPSYKRYIHSFEAGSAQQYLNLSGIKKMRLMIPARAIQDRFVEVRQSNSILKERAAAAAMEVDSLFSSLVARAFSGQLERSDAAQGAAC